MNTVIADVESDGLLPELTRLWCISVADKGGEPTLYADQPGYPPIIEALARLQAADRIVFHNGLGFDLHAINKVYPGTIRFEQVWDSIVVSRLLDPQSRSHALAAWGERLGFPKGKHEDWSQFSDEMAHYCNQDVAVTQRVYSTLQTWLKRDLADGSNWRRAVDLEHKVAFVIGLQEQHGFRVDVRAIEELAAELNIERAIIEGRVRRVFGTVIVPAKANFDVESCSWKKIEVTAPKRDNKRHGYIQGAAFTKIKVQEFNPSSRPQIIQRLSVKYRWRPRKFTPAGVPQVDESVLSTLPYPEAKVLCRYFRLQKMLGQIADGDNSWLKLARNGRIHGRVNPMGTITGRMSHFAPNVAQVDKDPRCRAVWLPDAGHKLVGVDADGLELRMLAHYLYPYDNGEYATAVVFGTKEKGTDAHSRTQKIAGLYSRESAKTLIYAFLYGAGDTKLGQILKEDAKEAGQPLKGAPATLGKAVRRRLETGITGLDRLVSKVQGTHKRKGYVPGLDGRRVTTRSAHSALNTLLQSAGAIVMKVALTHFHFTLCEEEDLTSTSTYLTNGFHYCANVHDEVQMTAPEAIAQKLGGLFADSIKQAGDLLNMRCELTGSSDIGDTWRDTH